MTTVAQLRTGLAAEGVQAVLHVHVARLRPAQDQEDTRPRCAWCHGQPGALLFTLALVGDVDDGPVEQLAVQERAVCGACAEFVAQGVLAVVELAAARPAEAVQEDLRAALGPLLRLLGADWRLVRSAVFRAAVVVHEGGDVL